MFSLQTSENRELLNSISESLFSQTRMTEKRHAGDATSDPNSDLETPDYFALCLEGSKDKDFVVIVYDDDGIARLLVPNELTELLRPRHNEEAAADYIAKHRIFDGMRLRAKWNNQPKFRKCKATVVCVTTDRDVATSTFERYNQEYQASKVRKKNAKIQAAASSRNNQIPPLGSGLPKTPSSSRGHSVDQENHHSFGGVHRDASLDLDSVPSRSGSPARQPENNPEDVDQDEIGDEDGNEGGDGVGEKGGDDGEVVGTLLALRDKLKKKAARLQQRRNEISKKLAVLVPKHRSKPKMVIDHIPFTFLMGEKEAKQNGFVKLEEDSNIYVSKEKLDDLRQNPKIKRASKYAKHLMTKVIMDDENMAIASHNKQKGVGLAKALGAANWTGFWTHVRAHRKKMIKKYPNSKWTDSLDEAALQLKMRKNYDDRLRTFRDKAMI